MFFELEDIKRRHTPTWSTNNTTSWHTAVDSTPSWNYQRGVFIGLVCTSLQQYITHFIHNSKLLHKHFETPGNVREYGRWFQQVRKLDSFKNGLKNRMQYAVSGAFFDIGLKIAVFRQFNSGWQSNFGSVEWNLYRRIPTTIGAFLVTSPFGVALDMAQRAFRADQTFPQQLQKGYKSYWDALRRIPFQEGPYYLFKNSFPLYMKHILGPLTAFYTYDYLIDKFSIVWRTTNFPALPLQLFTAAFSSYLAAFFTYPFVHTVREMVDFWPKHNNYDPWQGNYRKAASWLWFSHSWSNAFPGIFHNYFWHVVPLWFTSLLLADHFGIFRYWRIDIMSGASDNTSDDSFI